MQAKRIHADIDGSPWYLMLKATTVCVSKLDAEILLSCLAQVA
jgi:hypothetical protein